MSNAILVMKRALWRQYRQRWLFSWFSVNGFDGLSNVHLMKCFQCILSQSMLYIVYFHSISLRVIIVWQQVFLLPVIFCFYWPNVLLLCLEVFFYVRCTKCRSFIIVDLVFVFKTLNFVKTSSCILPGAVYEKAVCSGAGELPNLPTHS